MPRGYARVSARPATTSSTRIGGPSDSLEDALLRVRAARLNSDPFTAQHMAAYAAFAGITDRKTAQMLHRENVTWDDVNSFAGISDVNCLDYQHFVRLKRAGLTLDDQAAWTHIQDTHHVTVRADTRIKYAEANIRPDTVGPFIVVGLGSTIATTGFTIAALDANLTATQARAWFDEGCTSDTLLTYATTLGLTVGDLRSWKAAAQIDERGIQTTKLSAYLSALKGRLGPSELLIEMFRIAATPAQADAWTAIPIPPARAALYMIAGFSADEWAASADVRAMDDATLHLMRALSDHPAANTTAMLTTSR